jgi:hypothetical protein
MCKKFIYLTFVLVLSLVCASYTSAGIVYVDATDGEGGNTTLATGEVLVADDPGTAGSGADGLWRGRQFANGATIFEAGGSWEADLNTEDCPRLMTTVEVEEAAYVVYVYMWADGDQWRIQASLENLEGDLPLYLCNDPNGEATVAVAEDFEEPVPMLTEGNRTLWQVKLGTTDVTTAITVYIDDDPNHLVGGARTWYDGIGYEPAVEPVTEPTYPGTEGLVAYYPLDGDVTDASGNGHDGVIMGDPNFAEGIVGQALDLDGDGDYIDCGNDPNFGMQETNQMTAASWVTIRSIPAAWSAIVAKGEYAWRISNANLDPRFHFGITIWNAPDTFGTDGVTAVGFDEWHHVAGTFDGANINLYVDGALDIGVPTTEPIGANEASVLIGENPESTGRFWDGLIDEVMIYNRALSEGEILFLATPPQDPGTEGLVASYSLDGDLLDGSGNGNDGVMMGGDPVFVEGIAGQALSLDGVDDYVDCGSDPNFGMQETNQMTAAGWCSIRACTNAWQCIVAKGEYAWRLSDMNLSPSFHFGITWWQSADAYGVNGATAVGFDEWHHVAGSFDGENINIYLDGILDGTQATTEPIGANEQPVLIGNNPYDLNRWWDGLIDEVVIYNRALSAHEIIYLAQ